MRRLPANADAFPGCRRSLLVRDGLPARYGDGLPVGRRDAGRYGLLLGVRQRDDLRSQRHRLGSGLQEHGADVRGGGQVPLTRVLIEQNAVAMHRLRMIGRLPGDPVIPLPFEALPLVDQEHWTEAHAAWEQTRYLDDVARRP